MQAGRPGVADTESPLTEDVRLTQPAAEVDSSLLAGRLATNGDARCSMEPRFPRFRPMLFR
jgi:hypothetical protein